MSSEPPVYILLATYNGERFLAAQLDSLVAQDHGNWILLVRDDGSSDRTPQLVERFARSDPRVRIVASHAGRLGSAASFFVLMQQALDDGARYFALCDQDDVWQPDKLSRQHAALRGLERASPPGTAALCWSDLSWIDAGDRVLAGSHFHAAGLATALSGAGPWLLAMNAVPGCAMFGNRALLERALPQPAGVEHHDWWLVLLAAASGRIRVIEAPLVGYRQHAANAVGAASLRDKLLNTLRSPARMLAQGRTTYWQAVVNATCLRQRLGRAGLAPGWDSAVEHAVEQLGAASAWRRLRAVMRGPVRRLGWARNLLMLASAVGSAAGAPADRSGGT